MNIRTFLLASISSFAIGLPAFAVNDSVVDSQSQALAQKNIIINELQKTIYSLQFEVSKLKHALVEQQKNAISQEQYLALEKEIAAKTTQLVQNKIIMEELNKKVYSLQFEVAALDNVLNHSNQNQFVQFEKQLTDKNTEVKQQQIAIDQLRKEKHSLQADLNQAQRQNQDQDQDQETIQITALEKKLAAKDTQLKQQQIIIDQLRKDKYSLQANLNQPTISIDNQAIDKLKQQIAEQKIALAEKDILIEELRKEQYSLQAALNKQELDLNATEEELASLQNTIESLYTKLDSKTIQVKQNQLIAEELRKKLYQVQSDLFLAYETTKILQDELTFAKNNKTSSKMVATSYTTSTSKNNVGKANLKTLKTEAKLAYNDYIKSKIQGSNYQKIEQASMELKTRQNNIAGLIGGKGTYTIKKGDTLGKIAKQYYGKAGKWTNIFKANNHIIRNPDVITIGMVIIIP